MGDNGKGRAWMQGRLLQLFHRPSSSPAGGSPGRHPGPLPAEKKGRRAPGMHPKRTNRGHPQDPLFRSRSSSSSRLLSGSRYSVDFEADDDDQGDNDDALDQELELLHLSRQDNPYLQSLHSSEAMTAGSRPTVWTDDPDLAVDLEGCPSPLPPHLGSPCSPPTRPLSVGSRMPTSEGEPPLFLEEIHSHLIRSPPPVSWPFWPSPTAFSPQHPEKLEDTFSPTDSGGSSSLSPPPPSVQPVQGWRRRQQQQQVRMSRSDVASEDNRRSHSVEHILSPARGNNSSTKGSFMAVSATSKVSLPQSVPAAGRQQPPEVRSPVRGATPDPFCGPAGAVVGSPRSTCNYLGGTAGRSQYHDSFHDPYNIFGSSVFQNLGGSPSSPASGGPQGPASQGCCSNTALGFTRQRSLEPRRHYYHTMAKSAAEGIDDDDDGDDVDGVRNAGYLTVSGANLSRTLSRSSRFPSSILRRSFGKLPLLFSSGHHLSTVTTGTEGPPQKSGQGHSNKLLLPSTWIKSHKKGQGSSNKTTNSSREGGALSLLDTGGADQGDFRKGAGRAKSCRRAKASNSSVRRIYRTKTTEDNMPYFDVKSLDSLRCEEPSLTSSMEACQDTTPSEGPRPHRSSARSTSAKNSGGDGFAKGSRNRNRHGPDQDVLHAQQDDCNHKLTTRRSFSCSAADVD